MEDNKESIFRKSSLERVSSPEQLNEYVKITNPSLIAILVAIFLILFGCSFWVFSGSIPKYLDLTGVVAEALDDNGEARVFCYVPISTAKRLKENMDVQISPDYAPREQYGYVNGKVINIGDEIVTESYLETNFENPKIVLPAISDTTQNLVEVELSLGDWSTDKGKEISITEGSLCNISVIESEQKPYQLIFNV